MSGIKTIQNTTGASWASVVMSLLMLAFIIYILSNGSIGKYKQLLF